MALHDVAGRVRGGAQPHDGLDGPGLSSRPGLIEEYTETTGAVLGSRDGVDAFPDIGGVYGGAWQGPVFVLTHDPEDAPQVDGVTFLSRPVATS